MLKTKKKSGTWLEKTRVREKIKERLKKIRKRLRKTREKLRKIRKMVRRRRGKFRKTFLRCLFFVFVEFGVINPVYIIGTGI
jgi:transposase